MNNHPSDYSFLKSGFNNLIEPNKPDEETLLTVSSLVTAFMDSALREATTYVEHAGRNGITKQDIILSLKSETFKFLNRPDINDNVQKWREIIQEEHDDDEDYSDSDIENDDNEEDEIQEFTKSECQCKLCAVINNIEHTWDQWCPQTPIEKILKKVIDTKF